MNKTIIFTGLTILLASCVPTQESKDDLLAMALDRKADLQLGVYITAQAVDQLLAREEGRREAISILHANGITKAYVEVYRGGLVVPTDRLKSAVDFFHKHGFEVVGGIATVPGDNFGVRQEARYSWFNWQAEKTQEDLKKVMLETAPLFDAFIVDDFLCTADTSKLSNEAKGDRSWSEYRRDLLVELSSTIFTDLPKKENPNIQMIIKYPQWYDRYHLFGYDVVRQNALFDKIWIGTETRGQFTQRFGFVQPYEGFINFRWMKSLAGDKMGGAWFDHIDCDDKDFIDQAYQSVLGGAQELILFNYFNLVEGHPGQHLLRMEFVNLADLAQQVARSPVKGISAYKSPNSDAGGDLYLMDFMGMMGIPIVPESQYPEGAQVIFLPTQAASDSSIYRKVIQSLQEGARIIFTAGFLANARKGEAISQLAGIKWPLDLHPQIFNEIIVNGQSESLPMGLDIETRIQTSGASALLEAVFEGKRVPYLTKNRDETIFVLNAHTFSQADFDAAGEVLLCPRPLGLVEIPDGWTNIIRSAFNEPLKIKFEAPVRVTFQPFGDHEVMIQNYNLRPVQVRLVIEDSYEYYNGLNGSPIIKERSALKMDLPARSRIWIKRKSISKG